jgi:hypothetical protein
VSKLLPFFRWCDSTAAAEAIRNSRVLFPLVESIHLLALTVLLGTIIVLSLRLAGAGLRGQSIASVARALGPLTFWSLATMLVSGSLLFVSEAMKCYDSPPFRYKMILLCAAIVFPWSVFRPAMNSTVSAGPKRRIATALVSLTLWFGVAAAGRAIGFY